jgi:hypothetical protein
MKACFDFLCGNHTRNLPVVRFNKAYNGWLYVQLGEQMRIAKQAAGINQPWGYLAVTLTQFLFLVLI